MIVFDNAEPKVHSFWLFFISNFDLTVGITACLLGVFVHLFQKVAQIQRAERWSPRARGEISYARFSFC